MFRITLLSIFMVAVNIANLTTIAIAGTTAETILAANPDSPEVYSPDSNWQKFIDRNQNRLEQDLTTTSTQVPITRTGVLISSTNSNKDESPAISHSDFFKPVTSSLAIQPLSNMESEFLNNLAKDMPDRKIGSRINDINMQQINAKSLSKIDYDFLVNLSDNVSDDKASIMLYSIARKRYQENI